MGSFQSIFNVSLEDSTDLCFYYNYCLKLIQGEKIQRDKVLHSDKTDTPLETPHLETPHLETPHLETPHLKTDTYLETPHLKTSHKDTYLETPHFLKTDTYLETPHLKTSHKENPYHEFLHKDKKNTRVVPIGFTNFIRDNYYIITKKESDALTDTIICNILEKYIDDFVKYYPNYTFNVFRSDDHSWYIDSEPLFLSFPNYKTTDFYVNFSIKIYKIYGINQYCIECCKYNNNKCNSIIWSNLNEDFKLMFEIDDTKYDIKGIKI